MASSATRLEKLRDEVEDKKKVVTEGLVIMLDYNENRMVEVGGKQYLSVEKGGHEDSHIHIGTIGKS